MATRACSECSVFGGVVQPRPPVCAATETQCPCSCRYTEVYWVESGAPLYSKFHVPVDHDSYAAAFAPASGVFRSCKPFTNSSGDFWLRRVEDWTRN